MTGASFTWTSANSDSETYVTAINAAEVIAALAKGALKLRRQTDVDGNPVSFQPTVLVVPPELEGPARQALGSYSPVTSGEVNPFGSVSLQIEHHLSSGTVAYLVDSAYSPLVIGRIGGQPIMSSEEQFSTGNYSYRVQHDFGTARLDQRSICRLTFST